MIARKLLIVCGGLSLVATRLAAQDKEPLFLDKVDVNVPHISTDDQQFSHNHGRTPRRNETNSPHQREPILLALLQVPKKKIGAQ